MKKIKILIVKCINRQKYIQSNLFITDTKGTGISVRIIEVGFINYMDFDLSGTK